MTFVTTATRTRCLSHGEDILPWSVKVMAVIKGIFSILKDNSYALLAFVNYVTVVTSRANNGETS